MDVLDDLPPSSRRELIAAIQAAVGVTTEAAEAILRASEPFWNVLEDAGGLVDSWGGSELCDLFPKMCAVIRS
jgi:hypothetical protein